jgi:Zn-dependent M28 family amino/carboxypeptidase
VIFLATSGEETGYWGSDAFAGDSTTPLAGLVANINIDGVGRPTWADSLVVLGGDLSTLGDVARGATGASGSGIHPVFESTIAFGRSDHYSFARRGVPSVHLFSGTLFPYYHTVRDEYQVIDFPWLARVASYAFTMVRLVADDPRPPSWHGPAQPGLTRW